MPRLREQQTWLASLVLEPERPADDRELLRHVAIANGSDARERIAVYVDGYPARLLEALDEAYPAVHHVIGDAAFGALVRRYAPSVPSGIYSLTDVGSELPRFLASDVLTARLPMLPDLAALEWCVLRAFHAHECSAFDATSLAHWGLDQWESACVVFQPSVSLVRSAWPIHDLWELSETPIASIDLEVEGRPQDVLVSRSGASVVCELVEPPQAVVVGALLEGLTLGDSLARLAVANEEVADVSGWFAAWAGRGLIAECRSDSI